MIKNIIGVIIAIIFGLTLAVSFYFGRLCSMKDDKAVNLIISNQKKGKEISRAIYLVVIAIFVISLVMHFVF